MNAREIVLGIAVSGLLALAGIAPPGVFAQAPFYQGKTITRRPPAPRRQVSATIG